MKNLIKKEIIIYTILLLVGISALGYYGYQEYVRINHSYLCEGNIISAEIVSKSIKGGFRKSLLLSSNQPYCYQHINSQGISGLVITKMGNQNNLTGNQELCNQTVDTSVQGYCRATEWRSDRFHYGWIVTYGGFILFFVWMIVITSLSTKTKQK